MTTIHRNYNSNIAIELSRTNKKVRAIMQGEGNVRRIYETSIETFDKEWKPVKTDVIKAIKKWLDSHNKKLISLTERARKELIMLILINNKHEFVGRFNDEDFQKVVDASEAGAYLAKCMTDLLEFTGVELATLHNSLFPEKQIDRARNKEGCAEVIWKKVEELAVSKLEEKASAKTEKTPSTPKEGAVFHICQIINANKDKSRKEVIELCVAAGYNKATIQTQYGKIHKGEEVNRMGNPGTGIVAEVKKIISENFGKKTPKEIIELCVAAGAKKATAQTQYYIHKKAAEAK